MGGEGKGEGRQGKGRQGGENREGNGRRGPRKQPPLNLGPAMRVTVTGISRNSQNRRWHYLHVFCVLLRVSRDFRFHFRLHYNQYKTTNSTIQVFQPIEY